MFIRSILIINDQSVLMEMFYDRVRSRFEDPDHLEWEDSENAVSEQLRTAILFNSILPNRLIWVEKGNINI